MGTVENDLLCYQTAYNGGKNIDSTPGDISSNSDKNNVRDINLLSADNEMLL